MPNGLISTNKSKIAVLLGLILFIVIILLVNNEYPIKLIIANKKVIGWGLLITIYCIAQIFVAIVVGLIIRGPDKS